MKASELIKALAQKIQEDGDLEIRVSDGFGEYTTPFLEVLGDVKGGQYFIEIDGIGWECGA